MLATVLNNRFPGRLTTDAGAKALTLNTPHAGVIGEPGMDYNAGSDEFGVDHVQGSRRQGLQDRRQARADRAALRSGRELYDQIYGIRKDRVEVVWPITARGQVAVAQRAARATSCVLCAHVFFRATCHVERAHV